MQNPDNFQALKGEEQLTTQANSTDVEYDELEEMLRADAPAGSDAAAGAEDDSLDSLDSLLAESLQQVSDRKASQALLSRIRQGRATESEKAQASAVELKASWTPIAKCEMWDQAICECGHTHAVFTQYMVEYRPHHSSNTSHRWVKVEPEALPSGLPVKAIFNTREVYHCSECSSPPDGAEIIIWASGSLPQELGGEE